MFSVFYGSCEFKTVDGIKHKIEGKWDLIVAHPPYQFLTNTGNAYLSVEKLGEKQFKEQKTEKGLCFNRCFIYGYLSPYKT